MSLNAGKDCRKNKYIYTLNQVSSDSLFLRNTCFQNSSSECFCVLYSSSLLFFSEVWPQPSGKQTKSIQTDLLGAKIESKDRISALIRVRLKVKRADWLQRGRARSQVRFALERCQGISSPFLPSAIRREIAEMTPSHPERPHRLQRLNSGQLSWKTARFYGTHYSLSSALMDHRFTV